MQEKAADTVPSEFRPDLTAHVGALLCGSPRQVEEHLQAVGYRGQEEARRAVAGLVYRHVLRARRTYVDGAPESALPPREAWLLGGPTGVGKSYLLELLRDEVLDVPVVVVNAVDLLECHSVDQVVSHVVSRLLDMARHPLWAKLGVICIDGLQELRLADGSDEAKTGGDANARWKHQRYAQLGIARLLHERSVVFHYERGYARNARARDFRLTHTSLLVTDSTERGDSGYLPRLMDGFTSRARLGPLSRADQLAILEDTVRTYRHVAGRDIEYSPAPEVLDQLVASHIDGGSGVRAARDALLSLIADFCDEGAKEGES